MRNSHSIWLKVFFIGYVVLTAFAAMHHEPWRDEAQAWLIARDVSIVQLFAQGNYEGSPVLWHLILLPFAKLGAPYFSMHVVHLLIAYGIVYLFLFKSDFPVLTRVLFVFSYYMFWEYAVIARSYSLSILLLFGIAVLYKRKLQRPVLYGLLLLLLFNTNVHSMPIALGLSLAYAFEVWQGKASQDQLLEGRGLVIGGMLMLAGLLVAVAQLLPAPDNINQSFFQILNWKRPFIAFANAFFPNVPDVAHLAVLLALLIAGLHGYAIYRKDRLSFLILTIAYTGLGYIFVFKHIGSIRHHGFLFVILLFVVWIAELNKEGRKTPLERVNQTAWRLCLGISVFFAVQRHISEYNNPFSGAEQAAAYLNQHSTVYSAVVANPSVKGAALAPYLEGMKLWYADVESEGTYITWNDTYKAQKDISQLIVLQRARDAFGEEAEGLVFLLDASMPDALSDQYELVFQTTDTVFGYGDETYFLYRKVGDKEVERR